MPMLMKLFATNIVASNFFGRSKSLEIIENALGCSSKPWSISDFVNENMATSTPEINAEQNSNIISNNNPEINAEFTEIKKNMKHEGSGSKIKIFN